MEENRLTEQEKHWRNVFYAIVKDEAEDMINYLKVCGVFSDTNWKANVTHASHKLHNEQNPASAAAYHAQQQVIKKVYYDQQDTLAISDLLLTYVPTNIETLTNLKTLYINEVDVKHLYAGMSRLVNLQTLKISKTPLVELPEWVGDLSKLKTLEVTRCRISTIPESVGKLRLLWADFSFNFIADVPDSLLRIPTLERLNLSRNPLSVAWKTDMLPRCGYLSIVETRIQTLPSWLVARLVQLCWSDCGTLTFPSRFGFGECLQHLDLSSNGLRTVPDGIGSLRGLKYLNLSNNHIAAIPLWLRQMRIPTLLFNGNTIAMNN
jgi:Leucine-rich repeat (LRR) protein